LILTEGECDGTEFVPACLSCDWYWEPEGAAAAPSGGNTALTSGSDTLASAIHRDLGLPPSQVDVLARQFDQLNPNEQAVLGLSQGAATGIAAILLESATAPSVFGAQSHLDQWAWGSFVKRRRTVEILATRALTTSNGGAQQLARAALLLASCDEVLVGHATALNLMRRDTFPERLGWPQHMIDALNHRLVAERERSGRYISPLKDAIGVLEAMIQQEPQPQPEQARELIAALEIMAAETGVRADLQWRISNLLWRAACLVRACGRDDILQLLRDAAARIGLATTDHFSRWLKESITHWGPPPTSAGTRLLSSKDPYLTNLQK
jgi:hypothetical protein